MQVRFTLAVVTGAGSGAGQGVAVHLARAGAAVLCCDHDVTAAQATAGLVTAARTRAWSLQVDPARPEDVDLLAARARDLGGADLLIDASGAGPSAADLLAAHLVSGLDVRRGRRGPGAVVVVAPDGRRPVRPRVDDPHLEVRLMAVRAGPGADPDAAGSAVLRLLANGSDGEVADLA